MANLTAIYEPGIVFATSVIVCEYLDEDDIRKRTDIVQKHLDENPGTKEVFKSLGWTARAYAIGSIIQQRIENNEGS